MLDGHTFEGIFSVFDGQVFLWSDCSLVPPIFLVLLYSLQVVDSRGIRSWISLSRWPLWPHVRIMNETSWDVCISDCLSLALATIWSSNRIFAICSFLGIRLLTASLSIQSTRSLRCVPLPVSSFLWGLLRSFSLLCVLFVFCLIFSESTTSTFLFKCTRIWLVVYMRAFMYLSRDEWWVLLSLSDGLTWHQMQWNYDLTSLLCWYHFP